MLLPLNFGLPRRPLPALARTFKKEAPRRTLEKKEATEDTDRAMLSKGGCAGWWNPTYPSTGGEQSLTYWGGKGKGKGHWPSGSNPRSSGFEAFGHSTSKIPPYWEPSLELKGHPFRVWLQDLGAWSAGSELAAELVAPAVVQRLGGAARKLVRAVPAAELRDGRLDVATGVVDSGLQIGSGTGASVRRIRGRDLDQGYH